MMCAGTGLGGQGGSSQVCWAELPSEGNPCPVSFWWRGGVLCLFEEAVNGQVSSVCSHNIGSWW